MKWFILALFVIGGLWEVLAYWGARRDARGGQSADVSGGNWIIAGIGFMFWGVDLVVTLIWLVVRE
jgi:hypothetical protein